MAYIYPNSTREDLKNLKFYPKSNVQLDEMPREALFKDLDEIVLKKRKDIQLRLYGFRKVWGNYAFIKDLKHLSNLRIEWAELENLEILNTLDLKELHLLYLATNPSLIPITKHKKLKSLTLIEQDKNIECIEQLTQLRHLYISRVKIKNLNILSSLKHLKTLSIRSCGNVDLSPISRLAGLTSLNIGPFYNQTNFDFISNLKNLETLRMYDLRSVTALPKLSKLTKLRNLEIKYLNKLTDISELKNLKSLSELRCIGCRNLHENQFKIFKKSNALKKIYLSGEKAYKRNEEIRNMLKNSGISFMKDNEKAFQ